MIGRSLRQYVVTDKLGQGGMGVVWKARDTILDRDVALKVLPVDETNAAARKERFFREAKAASALNHPGIITIYEINSDQGIDFIAMEFVPGHTLAALLRRGRLAIDHVLELAHQIAETVGRAHHAGIVHRDLKPGNIMVSDDGLVKVLDFGLAKRGRAATGESTGDQAELATQLTLTQAGATVGTVGYMSPEQAIGDNVDARSDVFSFGVIMYEMLAGTLPFQAGNRIDVLHKLHFSHPPSLGSLRSDIPGPVVAIVERALMKQPSERYEHLAEAAAAVREAMGIGTAGGFGRRFSRPVIASSSAEEPHPSIAVLPFADMSPGKDSEYFGDGLAEEIINALTRIDGLKVIARTSAFAFKGQPTDIRRIAGLLGVTTVLEGSVRKAGSRIRVTAQLISAADGSHLWSERYDRELVDVFAVQDEIAAAITTTLKAKLSPLSASTRHTPSLEAYEAYLKGRHYQFRFTAEDLARSREYFKAAVAADPQYALAHHGLALHYWTLAVFQLMPAHDAMPLVRAQEEKALALNPRLPEAHGGLGLVAALYDYDWPEAGRRWRLAMARQPVSPMIRATYAFDYLWHTGHGSQAIEELERAVSDDPLSGPGRYRLGVLLLASGREAEGTAQLRKTLEFDERFWIAMTMLALHYEAIGDSATALTYAERAFALQPRNQVLIAILAAIFIHLGDDKRGSDLRSHLDDGAAYGSPLALMVCHLLRAEIEAAADCADKAIDQRLPTLPSFLQLPFARPLRASDRWPALARRMNLAH